MITINTISATRFSFNGVTYHKNFMPFVTGNKIAIINVYDGCITLTDAPTIFSDYTVNGATYSSVNDLQSALLDVIYTRNSLTNAAITLTTTGNSGAATLSGVTLNIPTYTLAGLGGQPLLTNPITGTGTTNYLPKFTGASTLGNSLIYDNGTNVGIGTTSPTGLLHIFGTNPAFRIQNSGTGNMQFGQWDGTNNRIQSQGRDFLLTQTDAFNILFATNDAERMRITSGGNVGINCGGLNAKLEVVATSGEAFRADVLGGAYRIIANQSGVLLNGNVGIGTTSPQQILHVHNSGTSYVHISNSTTGTGGSDGADIGFFSGETALNIVQRENDAMLFSTNNTERMRITSGGNVGIGTTSPQTLLHLTSGNPIFLIQETDQSADNQRWGIQSETSILKFRAFNDALTSATDVLNLTRSGNVGIGTTSPAQRLDVNGLINSTNGISVGGEGVSRFWTGTQAQYDAITTKVSTTVYLIT
jgi:hypothetical protein